MSKQLLFRARNRSMMGQRPLVSSWFGLSSRPLSVKRVASSLLVSFARRCVLAPCCLHALFLSGRLGARFDFREHFATCLAFLSRYLSWNSGLQHGWTCTLTGLASLLIEASVKVHMTLTSFLSFGVRMCSPGSLRAPPRSCCATSGPCAPAVRPPVGRVRAGPLVVTFSLSVEVDAARVH